MKSARKVIHILVFGLVLGPVCFRTAIAEDAAIPSADAAVPQASSSPPGSSVVDETADSKWHFYNTGYLWLPGIHGTLGVRGFDTSVHVSAIDLLSNFRLGFMGTFIPTYNRFSAPVDYFWVRLKDSKAIPSDPDYSVSAKVTESIITPKVAFLMINRPKVKVYGTMGPRIWHEGTTLNLVPSIEGRSPYQSANWVDFVAGARFSAPLGAKASVDVLGDAGEGGATLDYQVAGFLNYQVKPQLSLQGGWRYLTVHYGNNGNLFNGTMQGLVLGATYKFK
jgi:hypothetical protein